MPSTSHPNLTPRPLRSPHTYLHLSLLSPFSQHKPPGIDNITAHTYLTAALNQFLGLTGTAIPVDILKIDGRDVWVRCPRENGSMVSTAMSEWRGEGGNAEWRVKGRGDWLGDVGTEDWGRKGVWED